MRRAPLLALTLALALGGCTSTPRQGDVTTTPIVDLSQPWTWAFTGTGCLESDLLFFLDKAQMQRQLPEGFEAEDAQALFGAPVVPGGAGPRGLALANAFTCGSTNVSAGGTSEAQVAILVKAPAIAPDAPEAALDFYELARITPDTALFDALDSVGWEVFLGNVTAEMSASGGTGSVEQEGQQAYSMSVTTPGSSQTSGIARFWHVVPTGIAYVDYVLAPPVAQAAGTAECTIVEGSLLHNVVGLTSCGPTDSAGAGFPSFAPTIELHYLPNATIGG